MNTPDPASESAAPAVPATPDTVLTDYADLGTAFGLDASVASGMAAQPAADRAAGATAAPVMPWEHRLTRRTGL